VNSASWAVAFTGIPTSPDLFNPLSIDPQWSQSVYVYFRPGTVS
jgi:hypothetical protein